MVRVLSALSLIAFTSLSCSDMATQPITPIHVTGTILDRDGAPLAGSIVELQGQYDPKNPSSFSYYRGIAGASGHYSIDVVPGRYSIYVSPPDQSGYSRAYAVADFAGRTGTFDYRFTGFKVSGTVTAQGGAPLVSGWVSAVGGRAGNYGDVRGGSFLLFLPSGTYTFRVGPGGYSSGIPEITFPGLVIGADTTLTFALDGNLVRGTITGPGGQPMGGAQVGAVGAFARGSAVSLVDGSYAMFLPTQDYQFNIRPSPNDGYIAPLGPTTRSISAPQTIDFDLAGVEWKGVVRLAGSGAPISSALVDAVSYGSYGYAYWVTGSSGQFRLVLRPYGIYDLRVRSSGQGLQERLFEGRQPVNDSTFDITLYPTTP